jgi:hypothetical protein
VTAPTGKSQWRTEMSQSAYVGHLPTGPSTQLKYVDDDNYLTYRNTVADARTVSGSTNKGMMLLGTNSPGDGGGGTFYWNPSSTAPDDNGLTTIQPNGLTRGVWQRLTVNTVSGPATVYGTNVNGGPYPLTVTDSMNCAINIVNPTGPSWPGITGTGNPSATSGQTACLYLAGQRTNPAGGTVNRWGLSLGDTQSETGGDAGTFFNLGAFSDAGTFKAAVLTINRLNYQAIFAGQVRASSSAANGLAFQATSTAGSTVIWTMPYCNAGGFNPLVQAADAQINVNTGAVNTGKLVIGPYTTYAGGVGMRIDGVANSVTLAGALVNHTGPSQFSSAFGTTVPAAKTTATYTVAATDTSLLLAPAATMTLTLPAASAFSGRQLILKLTTAFAVNSATANVVPLAGGAATAAIMIATAGKFCLLQSDGTNWQIMLAN